MCKRDTRVLQFLGRDVDQSLRRSTSAQLDHKFDRSLSGDRRQVNTEPLLEASRRVGLYPQSLARAPDTRLAEVSGLEQYPPRLLCHLAFSSPHYTGHTHSILSIRDHEHLWG